MIIQGQIKELASFYRIDEFTAFREYLQLLFLSYLYQQKEATRIYFKGGTAIHLLFGSPRFSEDLDFSADYKRREIKSLIKKVEKELQRELPELKILTLFSGKKSIRFRLKYKDPNFKYPFAIRLDFTEKEKPLQKALASPLITKFPIIFFPIITHYSDRELLAEKVRAFLLRAKGRDLFDLWFLLEKKISLDENLIQRKLKEIGRRFEKEELVEKTARFSEKSLRSDLEKFLPRPQREVITLLKEGLISHFSKGIPA